MRLVSALVAIAVFGCWGASEAKPHEHPKIVPGSCHIVDKRRMCKTTNGEEREVVFHTVVVTTPSYASQSQTQCYLTDPTTQNTYPGCPWQGAGPCQCADESGQVFYGTAQ